MPNGKPAGIPCIHLDEAMACGLFGSAERPEVCIRFAPELAVCGNNRDEAMTLITWLEGASG